MDQSADGVPLPRGTKNKPKQMSRKPIGKGTFRALRGRKRAGGRDQFGWSRGRLEFAGGSGECNGGFRRKNVERGRARKHPALSGGSSGQPSACIVVLRAGNWSRVRASDPSSSESTPAQVPIGHGGPRPKTSCFVLATALSNETGSVNAVWGACTGAARATTGDVHELLSENRFALLPERHVSIFKGPAAANEFRWVHEQQVGQRAGLRAPFDRTRTGDAPTFRRSRSSRSGIQQPGPHGGKYLKRVRPGSAQLPRAQTVPSAGSLGRHRHGYARYRYSLKPGETTGSSTSVNRGPSSYLRNVLYAAFSENRFVVEISVWRRCGAPSALRARVGNLRAGTSPTYTRGAHEHSLPHLHTRPHRTEFGAEEAPPRGKSESGRRSPPLTRGAGLHDPIAISGVASRSASRSKQNG